MNTNTFFKINNSLNLCPQAKEEKIAFSIIKLDIPCMTDIQLHQLPHPQNQENIQVDKNGLIKARGHAMFQFISILILLNFLFGVVQIKNILYCIHFKI